MTSRIPTANYILRVLLLIVSTTLSMAGITANKLPTPPEAFSAHFIETRTMPGFNRPLVSRGVVIFDHISGITWKVTSPYHYVFEMGPSGVQEQMPDGSTRHLDAEHTPWLTVVRHIFTSAMTGDTSDLEHYFVVQVTQLKDSRRIELSPKPGPMANAIKHISVIEASTPESLHIDEVSGGSIDIRFFETRATAEAP
jgi:hypothetical protein